MREEKYDISGMHCAACSASVERVTRKLPGVARSEVNLTTGIMTIAYDESQCTQEQIVAKVEKAGFGAALHLEHPAPATVQNAEDAETAALKRRKIELIAAAVFSAVLLYVSMGQMLPFGLPALPLPDLFSMHTHPMNFAVLQLILAVPVLYCGRNFFQGGFKSLFHGNPNMDSLVAIGSGCSFAYSLVMTFLISDDPSYVHNLYYESAAVVLTLVSLGKFLESRNMQKTKGAITALMQLSPDTAILADTGREVPTSQLKVGDVVLVKPGARVPADGTVTQGESSVNEAMLTGESLPVEKAVGSEVIGGSVNENGVLYVQVTRTGDDSTLSRIIRFVEDAQGRKAPISKTADKVAGVFVPVVMGIALLAAVIWAIAGQPSIEDSVQILQGLAPKYEQYHGVKISEGILRQAVLLSERYITDRFLPDKAIDLIDEACSDLNLKDPDISRRMEIQRELDDYEKERTMLEEQEEKAEGDYARMAELKSKELQLNTELNSLLEKGDPQLSMENLAHVIELWTKIPAAKIREQEFQRLSQLEVRLKSHIIGQDEAVSAVAAAVRRNRVGISPKHKPVSFIFVGPTGVGKTELVKQLATDLFNTPDALIRLDMSEFMEKHSVSRLVGSPPGYVGYDEAGQLTEKIRRKPYAVVLFDEIEKAHPDVLNILLQILDDGEITDAHGRKVNFENTIIVMTSNAGSATKEGTVGFGRSVNEQDADRAMKALQQFLRPEFINRVDAVITFNRLSEENFHGIARIMLNELVGSLKEKGITFTYDDALVELLTKKSYSLTYGARNLRRTIQKELEDPMATKIIDSYEHPITQVKATVEDGAIRLYTL